MGRVTDEHERTLRDLTILFGNRMVRHSVVVVTSAMEKRPSERRTLVDRRQLMEQIGKLPPTHFLRRFVEDAGWRLVGIENTLEPFRSQSSLRLHQAVLDTVNANDGVRYQFDELDSHTDGQTHIKKIATALPSSHFDVGNCTHSFSRSAEGHGKHVLTIKCDITEHSR
jgi:hypothetical protein